MTYVCVATKQFHHLLFVSTGFNALRRSLFKIFPLLYHCRAGICCQRLLPTSFYIKAMEMSARHYAIAHFIMLRLFSSFCYFAVLLCFTRENIDTQNKDTSLVGPGRQANWNKMIKYAMGFYLIVIPSPFFFFVV